MRALMRMVVIAPGGTGRQADAKGFLVGGKTGSAEKTGARGGYSKSSNRTVFVSAFPMDAPRYVVFVLLDEPRGIKETYNFATAGWNAVPTVGTIVSRIGPLLGVFPMGHSDDFQPLTTLMQAYRNDGADEYAQPTLISAPVAPADPFGEGTTTTPRETDSDSIAGLIEDRQRERTGGGGEAQ
jgi:hypothetical protein